MGVYKERDSHDVEAAQRFFGFFTDEHARVHTQILELDYDSLCGPEFSPPVLIPIGPLDEYFPNLPPLASPTLPRLVDLLPPSLEAFRLVISSVLTSIRTSAEFPENVFLRLRELLIGFRDERSTKVPRLDDIVFNLPSDIDMFTNKRVYSEFHSTIDSIVAEVPNCGVKWERGNLSCFRTFNDRFDVQVRGRYG